MDHDAIVRNHLLALLVGGNAHLTFEEVIADFPEEAINSRAPNVPYSFWHLLEHMRIAQWDILEYIRNPHHVSPKWPDEYWPSTQANTDSAGWNQTIQLFQDDLHSVRNLVGDPQTDLYSAIPHGYAGHTILREVMLVADHNAYHIGEFGILRQITGTWPSKRG